MKIKLNAKTFIAILIASVIITSCDNNKKNKKQKDTNLPKNDICTRIPYNLIESDGIFIEKFDSTITDENRFNYDNQIYTIGKEFIYAYYFIAKNGKKHLFCGNRLGKSGLWELIDTTEINEYTIRNYKLKVLSGMEVFRNIPNYCQTIIQQNITKNSGQIAEESSTGLIENENNIWQHPPRVKNFRVLELNPFPFIKKPFEIGNSWNWSLEIGDHWSNKEWKEWSGSITNNMTYEIISKAEVESNFGKIECYKIQSKAKSRIGETYLTAFFNTKYGFVKLDYTNIDGSKIIFELERINNQITAYNMLQ